MRYIGGKARIAKEIAKIITLEGTEMQYIGGKARIVVEPFCGALNVSIEMLKLNPSVLIHASDLDSDLIDMWIAVQNGWIPPNVVTKERYLELQKEQPSPERTFAGYGCSFSGKWFGGYASDNNGRNYALNAANSIKKIRPYLKNIVFGHGGYEEQNYPENAAVYCDPPYAGTTKPGTRGAFDHVKFVEWVKNLPNKCYVSEYSFDDLSVVWQKEVKTDMHTKSGKDSRIEKLFVNR